MGEILVVGVGPGHSEYVVPKGKQAIKLGEVLIGTSDNIELANQLGASPNTVYLMSSGISQIISHIEKELRLGKIITLLVSGDPGFYSLTKLIRRSFPKDNITSIPGIGSIQLGLAHINESWDDVKTISLHGRSEKLPEFLTILGEGQKLVLLLGGEMTTHSLAKYLKRQAPGLLLRQVVVMADLSLSTERIIETTVNGLTDYPPYQNCVLYIRPEPMKNQLSMTDDSIIKNDLPMTKEEIRGVILVKLKLCSGSIVWDIGSGTGAISIQAANLVGPTGKVYAVERSERGINTIKENITKFNTYQVRAVHGKAPTALANLPVPDRVVIGGSGGELAQILSYLDDFREFQGPVVIPTVTLDSCQSAINFLSNREGWDYQVDTIQVNSLSKLNELSIWRGENPITIITAEKTKKEK